MKQDTKIKTNNGTDPPLLTWADLSPPERLYIDRTRRGEDSKMAARRRGVTQRAYKHWEWSRTSDCPAINYQRRSDVTQAEAFVVLRRRRGYSQQALATLINRSRAWVNAVECGRDERVDAAVLVEFWRDHEARMADRGKKFRAARPRR